MRTNQVLYDAGVIDDKIDDPCFNGTNTLAERNQISATDHSMGAGAESKISHDTNIINLSLNLNEVMRSVAEGIGLTIKTGVLLAISVVWAAIALPAVILYLVFYKHLIEKLISKIRYGKRRSPYYYYKWKNHHLGLNWEA
jgi:hypothetical protein